MVAGFLVFHIALKLLGGSLAKEDIMFSLLIVSIILSVNANVSIARLEGRMDEFARSFRALADDFKAFRQEMREEFAKLKEEMRSHSH